MLRLMALKKHAACHTTTTTRDPAKRKNMLANMFGPHTMTHTTARDPTKRKNMLTNMRGPCIMTNTTTCDPTKR